MKIKVQTYEESICKSITTEELVNIIANRSDFTVQDAETLFKAARDQHERELAADGKAIATNEQYRKENALRDIMNSTSCNQGRSSDNA